MTTPLTGDTQFDGGRGLLVEEGRIGDWMQTWTGKRFYIMDPRPEDVDILDNIMALSMSTRYNGHCRFYSRMEHSILVSKIVPKEFAREAFCHDFEETYMPDLHRPAKRNMGKGNLFFKICDDIYTKAIAPKYGLPAEMSQVVKDADSAILILEKEALFPRSDPWDLPFPRPTVMLEAYGPEAARWAGLQRYCELFDEDFNALAKRMQELISQDHDALLGHWQHA